MCHLLTPACPNEKSLLKFNASENNNNAQNHRFEVYLDYRLLEATCYGLDGPEIESRWGEFFRTRPDRPSGPRSLLYNRHRFCFQGLKLPERGVDHPPLSSTEVKETVELYCISSGPS